VEGRPFFGGIGNEIGRKKFLSRRVQEEREGKPADEKWGRRMTDDIKKGLPTTIPTVRGRLLEALEKKKERVGRKGERMESD